MAISANGLVPKSLTAKPNAMLSPKQPVQQSCRTPPDMANPMVTGGILSVQDEKCPRQIELNTRYWSQNVHCLVDSSAMHSFILQAAVDRLKLKPKIHQRLRVTVADGKSFECDSVVNIELLFGNSMGNGSL